MKVTSFEISKKLAQIAFSRQPFWIWINQECCAPYQTNYEGFPAYDLETILEALPKQGLYFEFGLDGDGFLVKALDILIFPKKSESLADTAARLLILLHEKDLIKFD